MVILLHTQTLVMMRCCKMISFGVQFDKWRFNDKRWNHLPYDKSDPWNSFSDENIQLEFENDFITDGKNVENTLGLRLPILTF